MLTDIKNLIRSMSSYDDVCVIYDNFDYLERARHQVIGDTGTFHSHTTGKIVRGSCIPAGGLQQRMFHENVPLRLKDVTEAPGNYYDAIQAQISTTLIADAIRCAYPAAVDTVFQSDSNGHYPRMPVLDVLESTKTTHITLGPILEDEASIVGNYNVLDNIFLQQLSLDREKDFENRLYLVYGDQKTARLVRACRRERSESNSAYDCHGWVLPIPGLWHLRLNFLYMVMKAHFGGAKYAQQYSTLYTHMNHLGRRNIPVERAPFHHLEELVLHSFDARIVAIFLTQIRNTCDIKEVGAVEEYLRNLTPTQFLQHVEDIRVAGFGRDIGREANMLPPQKSSNKKVGRPKKQSATGASDHPTNSQPARIVDSEFLNHINYLQVVETYKTMKYAIKHADIGLLKRTIARTCLYFAGAGAKNYTSEMLQFWRLIATDACDPPLQRAILANGLVNNRGKQDSFFEADRLNELLNLELKELLRSRGNSTFGIDSLFRWSVLTTSYTGSLREKMEHTFGEMTNTKHTIKSPAADIQALADLIADDSMVRRRVRVAEYETPALSQLGYDRLLGGGIADFNARIPGMGRAGIGIEEDTNLDGIADLPPDLQMFSLMVGLRRG